MEFLEHILPNGLEIVAECNDAAYSTALGFFVNTGSRDETDAIAGVSHFLEHMVFKGTARRSADDVNREFDEMGAHYNAFTNEENTVFYAAVLPEHQDRAVDLLADILRPSLREDDFHTEKKVILEEIQMYEDQPPFGADDKCRALYYGSHPLGRSVLGTAESIGDLTAEAMHDYFRRRYSPGNIVLAGAGRIDFDALVAAAERCCGDWEPAATSRNAGTGRRPRRISRACTRRSATQQYTLQLAAGPAAEDDDRYAAKLLATVLGDDSGSRLYWELVDPGLGRTCQPEPRRAPGRRHDDDLHVLRAANKRPTICSAFSTCTARPRPTASRRPSWNRRRTRFARASCSPASVPAAGCSPSATIGSTAASTARSMRNWRPWPASRSTIWPPCWRSIRSADPPR